MYISKVEEKVLVTCIFITENEGEYSASLSFAGFVAVLGNCCFPSQLNV